MSREAQSHLEFRLSQICALWIQKSALATNRTVCVLLCGLLTFFFFFFKGRQITGSSCKWKGQERASAVSLSLTVAVTQILVFLPCAHQARPPKEVLS